MDLFCGAGGVSVGLQRAGFEVTGVDIEPQLRHRGGRFIQADAMTFPLDGYDLVWASPPCQAYSQLRHRTKGSYPDLVEGVRRRLGKQRSYTYPIPLTVIENVEGAPLRRDLRLCGSMFGLDVKRHRVFECAGHHPWQMDCAHKRWVPRFPRVDRRLRGGLASVVTVCGTGGKHGPGSAELGREAMGIDWMTRKELSQAVPPIYAEYIGRHALEVLRGNL